MGLVRLLIGLLLFVVASGCRGVRSVKQVDRPRLAFQKGCLLGIGHPERRQQGLD